MKKDVTPGVVLNRILYPTSLLFAAGTFLFLSTSLAAAAGEVLIAFVLLVEGVILITDFRGYASDAVRDFKREPQDLWARCTPWWMLRFGYGSLFVWVTAMYLWGAARTIS